MNGMDFEILYIEDCPGVTTATDNLRAALDQSGSPGAVVALRMLRTRQDLDGTAFAGSPTITVDGIDLFPTGSAVSELACRVYSTPSGLAPSPTVDQISARLRGL